jgi:pyruvate formate lyase activating enzyme
MKEADFYYKLDNGYVRCTLCPHMCQIPKGEVGICFGRQNMEGKLYSLTYAQIVSLAIDPIEKKPLYHYYPGKQILSIGPNACNLKCKFCQNWSISQQRFRTSYLSPRELVKETLKSDSFGISYTYSEPFMWYEYIIDTSIIAKEHNLTTVLVTNGTINPEPLDKILPYIDAMNIDLKAMTDEFYKDYCNGFLKTVLNTIKTSYNKCHIEITNLVIPTLNDSDSDFQMLIDFVASVSSEIPLHFSRYHTDYKLDIPATPIEKLYRAKELAAQKLKYVYIGNIMDERVNSTFCPKCGALAIKRNGFYNVDVYTKNGNCPECEENMNIRGLN